MTIIIGCSPTLHYTDMAYAADQSVVAGTTLCTMTRYTVDWSTIRDVGVMSVFVPLISLHVRLMVLSLFWLLTL